MSEATRNVEARGKNVEDAIQRGLAQLGVRRDQVDITVLTEGSRGILGIGAEDARVRLTVLVAVAPPPARQAEVAASHPVAPPPPASEWDDDEDEGEDEDEADDLDEMPDRMVAGEGAAVEQLAAQTVREIVGRMGLRATVTGRQSPPEEGDESVAYLVDVRGSDLNSLVGRRGEGLDALQFLTRLIVQHRTGEWASIVVDVDGYRERRAENLRRTARQMAERVKRDGRSISLEPMPPYERRIIHLTLRTDPDVMTVSVGEGDARKVTIRPKK